MDALDAIHNRRSIKRYTGDPVPQDALQRLVEAGYDGPSGGNKNPWQFVVVTDRATLDRLSGAHQYCGWLKTAQAGIAIVADPSQSRYWLEDCCAAAENVLIAATALGLGAAWAAMYLSDNPEEAARRESFVRETLGIPESFRVPMVLGIGVPATLPGERKRPDLGEIVHWGAWGRRI